MTTNWKTLVAIATYNERENIPDLVKSIRQVTPTTDLLVIDDGSPDGTGSWCEQMAGENAWFHFIQRGAKQGLGTATICGMQFAIESNYDLWIGMDADLSHPPERLPAMIAKIGERSDSDYDLVIGSRYIAGGSIVGWPLKRRLMSRAVNFYSRVMLGLSPRDCSGAFRCCRVPLLEQLDFSTFLSTGYSFMEEFLWRMKRIDARMAEVPIQFLERQQGQSKLNYREALKALGVISKLGIRNWLGRDGS